jgi:transposase
MVGAAENAALKDGGGQITKDKGGRPRADLDLVLEAFFYRLRNAGPWRDLPEKFGPWRTIYGWHAKWARQGLWGKMLKLCAKKSRGKVRLVDGTHVRAHQCAANPTGGAAAQAMGKTRGGRNTKLMVMTNKKGLMMNVIAIEGQAYEGHYVVELTEGDDCNLLIVGDKGFDDNKLRRRLQDLGHRTCFPGKKNRKVKSRYNKRLYRVRYRIENLFCRLKRWGCVATRRDKLTRNYLSLVHFAGVLDWLLA